MYLTCSLSECDLTALERVARSRTEAVRLVERARIVLAAVKGKSGPEVARQFGCHTNTVYSWVHRFLEQGLPGLEDKPRSGRPRVYTAEQYAEVVAAALTNPEDLDLPFASWTLDRLAAYLKEHKGIPIGRNRIDQILIAEGLRWQTQESWFSVKTDPEFKAKRGHWKHSTSNLPKMRS